MMRNLRAVAAADVLLISMSGGGTASAQKRGGVRYRHPACCLALLALHAQLPRRRGSPCRARSRHLLRNLRRWVLKFGPAIARRLRRRCPRPSDRWHLDEMVVRIAGKRMYLWRAADHEGEVLDMLVQRRRDS